MTLYISYKKYLHKISDCRHDDANQILLEKSNTDILKNLTFTLSAIISKVNIQIGFRCGILYVVEFISN